MKNRPDFRQLLDYNVDVLQQGIKIIDAYVARPDCDYSAHSGPHLRHVIEHFEALVRHLETHEVDYDTRERDPDTERDPVLARLRIQALQCQIAALDAHAMEVPIAVHLCGGLSGDDNFVSFSTLKRELLFVASHATHHYALVRLHCKAQGIDLDDDLGKAPSTVRHARQS